MPESERFRQSVAPMKQGNEAAEQNVREHLDLRLKFAEAVSRAQNIPIVLALRRYTDLYHHLNIGGQNPLSPRIKEARDAYEAQISTATDHDDLLRLTTAFFAKSYEKRETSDAFEPFTFDYDEDSKTVRLHFGDGDIAVLRDPAIQSPLDEALYETQRKTLKNMFEFIKHFHPDATTVKGGSWLYNLPSYRRLFPPGYTAQPEPHNNLFSGSWWGQFYDRTGRVHKERAAQFLENVRHLDPQHIQQAFPLQAISVLGDIHLFYEFYGIK